ncbi:MAG: homoserine O-acetyltransferase [Alphaproteobacteria bacterium]
MNKPNTDNFPCEYFDLTKPLKLKSGKEINDIRIAWTAVGKLNAQKDNAILICHALTGDQFVASENPITGKQGWWNTLVGPNKVIDTNKYYVICSNVLGGCMGTTGPASINPKTGKVWGLDFPMITISDMVAAQYELIEHLGIDKLLAVIGGSVGGMQALEWGIRYKEHVSSVICVASTAQHSAQNIAFNEVGRQAVMADPDWRGGDYYNHDVTPSRGLAVARMAAHVTYLSEPALQRKFGRRLQDREALTFGFDADFQIESYLRYQGSTFVDRFDANSYLYITRAADYFDLAAADNNKHLSDAFKDTDIRWCIISFSSDWLYPTAESRNIVKALTANAADVSFVEIESDAGHDAFLLDEPSFFETLEGFLMGVEKDA